MVHPLPGQGQPPAPYFLGQDCKNSNKQRRCQSVQVIASDARIAGTHFAVNKYLTTMDAMVVGWNVLKDLVAIKANACLQRKEGLKKSSVDSVMSSHPRTAIPSNMTVLADSPALSTLTNLSEGTKSIAATISRIPVADHRSSAAQSQSIVRQRLNQSNDPRQPRHTTF